MCLESRLAHLALGINPSVPDGGTGRPSQCHLRQHTCPTEEEVALVELSCGLWVSKAKCCCRGLRLRAPSLALSRHHGARNS